MSDSPMLRGRLLRSARLLLDWSQARLACEAGIRSGTVYAVEAGRLSAESPAAQAIVQALERGGVLLVPGCGQFGAGLRYAASCAPDHARRHPAALSAPAVPSGVPMGVPIDLRVSQETIVPRSSAIRRTSGTMD